MRIIDTLRELFNPKIIKDFTSLVDKNKEAVVVWCKKTKVIQVSDINNKDISFKDKKTIVLHKKDILQIDFEIRRDAENKRKYSSIKSDYPLGCKYFEENCISYGEETISKVINNITKIKEYQEICTKYERLKHTYPLGLPAFEDETSWDDGENFAGLAIEEIVKCEEDIKKCEIRERKKIEEDKRKKEEIKKQDTKYKEDANEIKKVLDYNNVKYF